MDLATSMAAKLVVKNLMTKLNCQSTPAKELVKLSCPFWH